MYAERESRFPKGTYKILYQWKNEGPHYAVMNLCTGKSCSAGTMWGVIKTVENDLMDNRFPQGCVKYRSWGLEIPQDGISADEPGETDTSNVMPFRHPAKSATFVVKILYRQNATWQGTIQWIEGRQVRDYRSVNELMKLMDEAVAYAGAQGPEPTTDTQDDLFT